jgi:hypothetical protein
MAGRTHKEAAMSNPDHASIRWAVIVTVAVLLAGIFLIAANSRQSVAMGIDQAAAAAPARSSEDGAGSGDRWNSPDNPNYPRLPALIVPPRGGDLVARP